jgi:low affinity Fe/Cu permease
MMTAAVTMMMAMLGRPLGLVMMMVVVLVGRRTAIIPDNIIIVIGRMLLKNI